MDSLRSGVGHATADGADDGTDDGNPASSCASIVGGIS